MKKNYKFILLFAFVLFLFAACASKPKVQETPPEPEKVEEPTVVVEDAPLLKELNLLKGENGKVNKAREKAIELGADKAYPDLFNIAEDIKKKAEADVEAGNLKGAIEKYNEAMIRYDTLSNLMIAAFLRDEIEKNGFTVYAQDDYVEAEKCSANTIEHYNLDYKMAKETSEDALKLYKNVLNKGYMEFSQKARDTAKEHKADCDSIKASRSRKEEYNKAIRIYNKGKLASDKSDYKEAYLSYTEAGNLFAKLYEEVSIKRAEAEKAMAEAAKKQQESSNLALEADQEAPLNETGEGFTEGELQLQNLSTPQTSTPIENIDINEDESAKPNESKANNAEGGL